MIEVERLSKDYGGVPAVSELTFAVRPGEVVGFLGPNGAGKSTTLRVLTGFMAPSRGRVRIGGLDVHPQPKAAQRLLGYLPEASPLYPELRVREYLAFRAALKGVSWRGRRAAVGRAMERANVVDVADVLIAHLSKGYRQRVGLADALVADPPLLILDEPTAGLDPNQIRDVRRLLAELRGTHTVLLSTHILQEVEASCERALVLHRGRLLADGTIEELRARRTARAAMLRTSGDERTVHALLSALPELTSVRTFDGEADPDERRFELGFADGVNPKLALERIIGTLTTSGVGVREARLLAPSLEEVFESLTRREQQ